MLKHSTHNGFSLIELLVAVVVFSVGMLAVAGLQTVSKSANFEGLQRTAASHVAQGLLEDIRANGNGMAVYLASGDLGGGQTGAEPFPNCETAAAPCNAAQKAAHDLWFWENMLDGSQETNIAGSVGGVVSPTVCFTGPAGGGAGIYAVTIVWRGTVALQSVNLNPCGDASGNYGDTNEFRRVLQVPTFIDPNI